MFPCPQDKYHLIFFLLLVCGMCSSHTSGKKVLKFLFLKQYLHSKVDIIFGKVNIKDNDSLNRIIHKGSQTLIFDNKKCETT
jgi:hypothetical protein